MLRMESFIESYHKGNTISSSLENFLKENPGHELALAMQKIRASVARSEYFEDAIEAVKQIDYQKYGLEEQLILFQLLCHSYANNNRLQNAKSILSNVKKLITPDLNPEYLILPITLESAIQSVEGVHQYQTEAFEKCLGILGEKSGHYRIILWIYLMHLCKTNELVKFEKYFEQFYRITKDTGYTNRINFILLLKNFENANFKVLLPHIQKLKSDTTDSFWVNDLIVYETLYEIVVNNKHDIINENNNEDGLLLSFAFLYTGKPEKALYWAHKHTKKQPNLSLAYGLLGYYLIRAELANGNINAAVFALERKIKNGNNCPFDDFFWFRIYHLKGDFAKAQIFYNRILTYIETEKLDQRLDFELKVSPELTLTDIRNYTKNFQKPTSVSDNGLINHQKQKTTVNSIDFLKGHSQEINKVKQLIEKFANTDTSVLICGETGTGKELVARALWQAGNYKNKPFVPFNCGAISDQLLQSELFGHQKGAFTGAYQDHQGLFEEAGDGIIFMDEIGEINHNMQINLLRILEAKEYRPVGSSKNKNLKCKIIAATNRRLEDLVKQGVFRQDLQFRLERLIIELPPLRERRSDIPDLINYFLNELNPNLNPIYFDTATLDHLKTLPWLGNIRELKNEMERIRLLYSDHKTLTMHVLNDKYQMKAPIPNQDKKNHNEKIINENNHINFNSKFRRLEELKKLFSIHTKLTRIEVIDLLKISPNTAANYLETLEKENFIKKEIIPNTRSQYYKLV